MRFFRIVQMLMLALALTAAGALCKPALAEEPDTGPPSPVRVGESLHPEQPAGQEPDQGPSERQLPEMVVTATAEPAPQTDVPVRVQIITAEDIRDTGASTVDQVLNRYVPGNMLNYINSLSQASIRGYRSRQGAGSDLSSHVLLLIDGNRAGTGNTAVIPVDNIERIEVYRGPCSVLYGASAMGGVINLITKRGKGDATGRIGAEYGSYDYKKGYGAVSGGVLDDQLGYSLAARATDRGDYHSPGQGKIDNSAYDDQAVGGSVTWRPNEANEIFFGGDWFQALDVGSPGSTEFPSETDKTSNVYQYANGAYDGSAMDGDVSWRVSGIYADQEYTWIDSAYDATSDTVTQGVRGHVSINTWDFGRFMIGGEYDNAREKQKSDPSGNVWSPNTNNDLYAVFAEQRFDIDRLTLYAGGRYDKFRLTLDKPNDYPGTVEESTQEKDQASWRGGAVLHVLDWLDVRAAAGSAFVPPTAQQLAGKFGNFIGNPSLDPETSLNFEGGLDVYFGKLETGLTYFWSRSRDTITTDTASTPGYTTYTNIRGVTLAGVEAYANYLFEYMIDKDNRLSFKPWLDGIFYTNRHNDDTDYNEQYGTTVPFFVSEYNLNFGLNTDYNNFVALDLFGQLIGPQKVQHWNANTFTNESLNKDSYAVFSAKLTVKPVDHVKVYLLADNLFDTGYEYVYGYPMPGFALTGGLEFYF